MFASTPARIVSFGNRLRSRLDLLELRVEAAVAEVVRVIGDGVVVVAARGRRLEHLLERVLAVGRPVRVRVQVAADVAELDKLRQLAARAASSSPEFSRSSGGIG